MDRKLFTAKIGSIIDCWFYDNDASDDCSVMSEPSNFEIDEEEPGNSLHESDEEVFDLESCSSTNEDEPFLSTPQSNSSSLFTGKNSNLWSADCPPPHGRVLAI